MICKVIHEYFPLPRYWTSNIPIILKRILKLKLWMSRAVRDSQKMTFWWAFISHIPASKSNYAKIFIFNAVLLGISVYEMAYSNIENSYTTAKSNSRYFFRSDTGGRFINYDTYHNTRNNMWIIVNLPSMILRAYERRKKCLRVNEQQDAVFKHKNRVGT